MQTCGLRLCAKSGLAAQVFTVIGPKPSLGYTSNIKDKLLPDVNPSGRLWCMGTPYLLGLDLGITSIGWALLGLDDNGTPTSIIRIGTHLFDSSNPAEFERGKDEPPAKPRRDARQLRKMIWRRARRKRKLLRLLQGANLLPPGDVSTPAAIDAYIKSVDAQLASHWNRDADHRQHQLLPYRLRAAGLDRDLSRVEFGRALYHLAQRRGFLSNRKSKEKADERSEVEQSINDLAKEMTEKGSRTLGEYFASINPEQVKLRRRWTRRAMFQTEFDELWKRQASSLGLSDEQRRGIQDAIFFQRPLKSMNHLVGRCRHLPKHRRAPMACRLFQRFRMLQKVNDLVLVDEFQNRTPLTPDQRAAILAELETHATVLMTTLRKLIKARKGLKFNFETEGEKSLPGHKTDARLAEVLPEYAGWPDDKKTAFVDELLGTLDDAPLRDRLRQAYKLSPEAVEAVEAVFRARLEDGYASLSRAAIRQLLPRMERGDNYMIVARDVFPDEFKPVEPVDRLPPILKYDRDLRNPTVLRGLTEVRKLVNLIVKRYGKPDRIHIELLRDLKKPRAVRAEMSRQNDDRRKLRLRAAEEIVQQVRVPRASARDIEKWLLADECGWECPYTGKSINVHNLFVEPQFEIEHIYPYSQSLDDSFANKTLCHRDANAEKAQRLPSRAFSPERLEEILRRVAHFRGDLRDAKLRRFKATEIPEGFTSRHLTDSSHLARAASNYLGLLYGGVNDAAGTKRIHTRVGGLTAQLRRLWGLNQILSETDEKTREDHRHHAIDAVVVGCTDTRTVAEMSRVASEQITWGRTRISELPPPFPDFIPQLVNALGAVVVSHRQSRRIAGRLHAESNYSRVKAINGTATHTIRKPVTALKESDFAKIIDPRIRAAVEQAFKDSKAQSPEKAFADGNFPVWESKRGKRQPIKRVRITTDVRPFIVGRGERARHVDSTQGSNHHARIIAILNKDGTEKRWRDEIVTRLDMHQRKAQGKLGVDTSVGPNERFKFSLAINEYVEIDDLDTDGKPVGRMLCRVLSLSKGDFKFVHHLDGRTVKQGPRIRASASWLKARNARKVFVNYLGEVKNAGG